MKSRDHSVRGYLERCSTKEIKQILKESKTRFDSAILYTAKKVLLSRKKQKAYKIKLKFTIK